MSQHVHFGTTAHPGAEVVNSASLDDARILARQMHPGHAEICAIPSLRITADEGHHAVAMEYTQRCAQLLDELGNSVRDAFEGLDAAAHNLQRFPGASTTEELRGAYAGQPAVCVAAGPSAQEHIQAIASAAPYARIFVCDAMTGALASAGITPDHVCTVERPTMMAGVHAPGDGWSVIAPITASAPACAKYGNACWWLTGDEVAAWAMRGKAYRPCPAPVSSGTLTVMAAIHAGCNPIVLVGHDLTTGADGATHAAGAATLAHALRDKLKNPTPQRQDARTVDPDGAPTTYLWQQMRNSMEEYIAWMGDGRTIYRVGTGLRICGALNIDRLPTFIVPKGARGIEPAEPVNHQVVPRLVLVREALLDMRVCLRAISKAVKNGTTPPDAAARCMRISALCTADDPRGLIAYLLQALYNQAHLRISMGRDYASVVARLAASLEQHTAVLADGADRLIDELRSAEHAIIPHH